MKYSAILPEELTELNRVLTQRGWELVGEGNYAAVYGKPGKTYVIKVFEQDSAYMAFLKLILSNPNPHFPKIIGEMRRSNSYRVLRMELLYPCRVDNISGMLNAYVINKRHKLNHIQHQNLPLAMEFLADKPELKLALDLIDRELLSRHGLDLSDDNIMQRRDGTIVVIDPIYF